MTEETRLMLDLDQPFSLGQLILASSIPSAMIYKVNMDGRLGQMLKYEGTWTVNQASSSDQWVQNHAHFGVYLKQGPGVWILSNHEVVSVPMTKEELVTMYRFYKPNRNH